MIKDWGSGEGRSGRRGKECFFLITHASFPICLIGGGKSYHNIHISAWGGLGNTAVERSLARAGSRSRRALCRESPGYHHPLSFRLSVSPVLLSLLSITSCAFFVCSSAVPLPWLTVACSHFPSGTEQCFQQGTWILEPASGFAKDIGNGWPWQRHWVPGSFRTSWYTNTGPVCCPPQWIFPCSVQPKDSTGSIILSTDMCQQGGWKVCDMHGFCGREIKMRKGFLMKESLKVCALLHIIWYITADNKKHTQCGMPRLLGITKDINNQVATGWSNS